MPYWGGFSKENCGWPTRTEPLPLVVVPLVTGLLVLALVAALLSWR